MARDTERVLAFRSRLSEARQEGAALTAELRERRGEGSVGYQSLAGALATLDAARDALEAAAVRLDTEDGIESP